MRYLEEFRKQKLLVFGDMMVDKYISGSVDRISPEAPVPVLFQKKPGQDKIGLCSGFRFSLIIGIKSSMC